MDKLIKFFCLMILLLGIGLVSGGVYMEMKHVDYMKSTEIIEATVTEVTRSGSSYYVYVSYEYEDVFYENIIYAIRKSPMSEGKKLEILFNPKYPTDIQIVDVYNGMGVIAIIIGSVLTLIGIFSLTISIKNSIRKKRLLENGQILYATVDDIDFDYTYTVNGDHPYLIYCSYKDEFTGKVYKFKSKITWKDPSEIFPIGSFIQVLVDSNDYTKYYVKLEEIMDQRVNGYS